MDCPIHDIPLEEYTPKEGYPFANTGTRFYRCKQEEYCFWLTCVDCGALMLDHWPEFEEVSDEVAICQCERPFCLECAYVRLEQPDADSVMNIFYCDQCQE